MEKEFETGQGLMVGSIKDRSLTAMLNACLTLSCKDKSFRPRSLSTIWAGNRPDVRAILVMVEENDEGTACNLGIPWIPWSPERSSGTGGACRTRELVLHSATR